MKSDPFTIKNKLLAIKILYFIIALTYTLLLIIFLTTNGSISILIEQNIGLILMPLLIPFVLSFIGLYDYSIEKNSEVIKIYSNCIIMSKFSEKFKNKMIIQKGKPFEKKISLTNFGFKKILTVEQNIQNKKVKSKINISLLSIKEINNLTKTLNINLQ